MITRSDWIAIILAILFLTWVGFQDLMLLVYSIALASVFVSHLAVLIILFAVHSKLKQHDHEDHDDRG